jgi:hypothetical protein
MGEAFVGIADDVNAVYWNPAGLTQITRNQVCLMHTAWLVDVKYEYVAYALPIQGFGSIGVYGTFLDAGEITKTDENALGDYILTNQQAKASAMNFSVAYAKKISDFIGNDSLLSDLSVGLNLNVMNETIYTDSGGGVGANLSMFYYPRYENYSMGLTVENIGVANNRPSLPAAVKLGFGYRFPFENAMLPFSEEGTFMTLDNNASGDIDIIYYPVEQIAKVHVGGEKTWDLNKYHTIALRLGYKFGEDLGAIAGITAGFGYRLTTSKDMCFEVDYAIVPYAELDVSNRISITAKFLGTAEKHFTEDVKEAGIYYKRGYDYLYKKQFSDALSEFASSVKRYRNYAPAYMGIGACFLNLGKKELAMKAYGKALELDPSNQKLRNYLQQFNSSPQFPNQN